MKKNQNLLLLVLAASLLYAAPAQAEAGAPAQAASQTQGQVQSQAQTDYKPIAIYLDGRKLEPETHPLIVDGTVLVPMRGLFEAQGAELVWNGASKTLRATKDDLTLTYRVGEASADLNGKPVNLSVPGRISDGYTLVPLRFVSETLGSTVKWTPETRTVQISSPVNYETTVLWGVNLRSRPDTGEGSATGELLPAGKKVHIIREVDALWLEVRTEDQKHGYISAKPKYTDYKSPSLIERQGEALIAYGKQYWGTPYEFGAAPDQTNTFDCSSFVKRVFQDTLGIELPRVSYNQAKAGQEVGIDELRPGDLLFFSSRGLDIGHVGIYAGDNQILHTYSKKLGVHIGEFSGQWKERFVTARRVF
ncbi:stalk domain-containing protein [Paenibacillus woosongensis]|uniref:SH3 domain-containing protein n=1 Tax=Paenibacillus woosongensis TaxID=307580 RepID=A0A7X2Z5S5_9BACL|nr:stalk domain-containing protein [Paenibacillus woosongensis]MUG48054.1 SH3 domain-containing protein [Paenibacillus woosongensis]